MRWRSQCKRELRLVQFGDNITLQASGVHSHAHETQHRMSVATLTSIHEAVQHNVTQSSTEIRRTVSREERHLTVLHQRKVQRVVVKERSKVMEAMAPPEVGFSSPFSIAMNIPNMAFFLYHQSIQTVLAASSSQETSIRRRCLTW